MARHTSEEAAFAELMTVCLVAAGIILAIICLVIVALVSELWRIFKAHVSTNGPARRFLLGALAGYAGLLLISGLLASNAHTIAYSLPLALWSFFVFVITCELIDRCYRPEPIPVPKQLSLADVVSWHTVRPQPTAVDGTIKGNGHVSSAAIPHQ